MFSSSDTVISLFQLNPTDSPFKVAILGAFADSTNADYLIVIASVTNISDSVLDAYSVGFELFSVFNEHLIHTSGLRKQDLKPGKTVKYEFRFLVWDAYRIGSVFGYSFKSRLKDGRVWIVDPKVINHEIGNVYKLQIDIAEEERKKLERLKNK